MNLSRLTNNSYKRGRPKVIVLRSLIAFLVVSLYCKLSFTSFAWYRFKSNRPCVTPESEMRELLGLAEETHEVLAKLGVEHFLVYGRYV